MCIWSVSGNIQLWFCMKRSFLFLCGTFDVLPLSLPQFSQEVPDLWAALRGGLLVCSSSTHLNGCIWTLAMLYCLYRWDSKCKVQNFPLPNTSADSWNKGLQSAWVELLVAEERCTLKKIHMLPLAWWDLGKTYCCPLYTKKLSRILFGNMVPLWRSRKPRNQPQCRRRKRKVWMTIKMPWAALKVEFLTSVNCRGGIKQH